MQNEVYTDLEALATRYKGVHRLVLIDTIAAKEKEIKEANDNAVLLAGRLFGKIKQIKGLEDEQARKDLLFEKHTKNGWKLVKQIKELKGKKFVTEKKLIHCNDRFWEKEQQIEKLEEIKHIDALTIITQHKQIRVLEVQNKSYALHEKEVLDKFEQDEKLKKQIEKLEKTVMLKCQHCGDISTHTPKKD